MAEEVNSEETMSAKERKALLRHECLKKITPSDMAASFKRLTDLTRAIKSPEALSMLNATIDKARAELEKEQVIQGEKMLSFYERRILRLEDRIKELEDECMTLTRNAAKYMKKCRAVDEDRVRFKLQLQSKQHDAED